VPVPEAAAVLVLQAVGVGHNACLSAASHNTALQAPFDVAARKSTSVPTVAANSTFNYTITL
jgi:hypothetical protein